MDLLGTQAFLDTQQEIQAGQYPSILPAESFEYSQSFGGTLLPNILPTNTESAAFAFDNGPWPREGSELTMFGDAYPPSNGSSDIYIEERPMAYTAHQNMQTPGEELNWGTSWPAVDNPAPGGAVVGCNTHENLMLDSMSYVATSPSFGVHYPGATDIFQFTTDNNTAWGTGLTAPSGYCGAQSIPFPPIHTKVPVLPGCHPSVSWQERHIENGYAMLDNRPADGGQLKSYPPLVVRNHPTRSVMCSSPYSRPTTRREFRSKEGALTPDISYKPHLMRHGSHVGPRRRDIHQSISLVSNDKHAASSLPQTLIPGAQVPHYLSDAMHVNFAGASLEASAISFNGGGPFPGHQQEGAADPSAIPHEAGCGTSQRRGDASSADDIYVDHSAIERPCGWNGCTTPIHPHRVQVRDHFIREHSVRPGAQLVSCVYPECGKALRANSLWQHWIKHLDVRIRCSGCTIVLAPRQDSFKRHVIAGCSGKGKFICNQTKSQQTE